MKFLLAFIVSILLTYVAGYINLPWWVVTPICLLTSVFIHQKPAAAFSTYFFAIFILWAGLAYFLSYHNNHIFAQKMALVLPLKGNTVMLFLVTGLLGGLVAGLSGVAGSFLRASK
jgi:hypothetical protein